MRVLFLTHRLPYAPNRGDRLRAFHILQWLRERATVDLVSLVHDDEEAGHVDEVRAFVSSVTTLRVPSLLNHIRAIATLATAAPLTHTLLDAPGFESELTAIVNVRRPDVVFSFGSGMARLALSAPLSTLPLILDLVDVDSRKWQDLSCSSRLPLSWVYAREARTLGAFEALAATSAVATLVVNEREAEIARTLAPAANVHVIANGVELERLRPIAPPSAGARVVVCGVMNYAPNDQGIRWFINEVWPIVKMRRPDATLAIVGADPHQSLRTLCARDKTIEITGRVPDVRPWLWESAVGIAPLQVARGVQNKALEAIAAGLPIVITPEVAQGLPAEITPAASVAGAPDRFAEHVATLLSLSPEERRALAARADLGALHWSHT
ncbi:MAG TPA: TIGR03087 family PEP-CTERM/XrtA system glycosyltransferase, partial [Vicinamibacterales bacterium]